MVIIAPEEARYNPRRPSTLAAISSAFVVTRDAHLQHLAPPRHGRRAPVRRAWREGRRGRGRGRTSRGRQSNPPTGQLRSRMTFHDQGRPSRCTTEHVIVLSLSLSPHCTLRDSSRDSCLRSSSENLVQKSPNFCQRPLALTKWCLGSLFFAR